MLALLRTWVGCLFLVLPVAASAQWVAGGLVGLAVPTGGNSRVLAPGLTASAEVGYRLINNLRVNVNVTGAWQGDDGNDQSFPDARLNSYTVAVAVQSAFGDYGFQPYFGLGAGAMFRNGQSSPPEVPGRQTQNDVVPILIPQIGLRLIPGPHLEVDARLSFVTNLSAGEEDEISKPFGGAFLPIQVGMHYRW